MNGIEVLQKEHDNILNFIDIIRAMCINIIDGKKLVISDIKLALLFARNYADKLHHGKEEKILFQKMIDHIDGIGDKLIRNGMLVEHDLGRLYGSQLEESIVLYEKDNENKEALLDIIVNACAYADLLRRHIAKENNVIFTFAERILSQELLESVTNETIQYEEDAKEKGIQDKYLNILEELRNKYLS